MPPKKKQRVESQPASTPSAAPTPTEEKSQLEPARPPVLDPDPWTDEQEIALFKGIIKWKPVGVCSLCMR